MDDISNEHSSNCNATIPTTTIHNKITTDPSITESSSINNQIPCTYSDCDNVFSTKYNLNRHLRTIHNEKPYKCDKCSAVFAYRKDVMQHCRVIHNKRINIDDLKLKLVKCPQCDFSSVITRNICYHIKNKHPYLATILIERGILKSCVICPWLYHCSQSHVCFDNNNKDNESVKLKYSKEPPTASTMKPIDKSQIGIIVNNAQSQDKDPIVTYKCTYIQCDRSFNKLSYLIQHIRSYHKGKPYKCNQCGSTFAYNKKLQTHRLQCKLYCICNKPKGNDMITCVHCKKMYHCNCIGISMTDVLHVQSYKCDECKQQEYCICKRPDDGSCMVQCNGCANWFHHYCIYLTVDDIKTLDEYNCDTCVWNAGFF